LGFGAGYYDRLLARPALAGMLRVAPVFGFQLVEALPAEPWDQAVQVVVTEEETLWV
jgi:5-formyltetrahydrofolate cyclo-ligase